jgi:plastocyanin
LSAAAADVSGTTKAKTYQVEIRNFAFAPNTLTVPAGTRVVWTNRDDEPHLVTSAGATFAPSKALDTSDSYAVTFAKPGTYAYYCSIHPMMVGTIIVQ